MCRNEESCGLIIVSSLEDSSHMKPAMWIFCTALPHSLTSSDPVIRRGRRAQMEHFAIICVFVYVCFVLGLCSSGRLPVSTCNALLYCALAPLHFSFFMSTQIVLVVIVCSRCE